MAAHNTVTFPTTRPVSRASFDTASVTSLYNPHHAAATEVCELFYGASPPAWQAIERYYDPNAVYENPFITATSKSTIGDVHALARFLGQLDVPKPGAVLCTLFGLSPEHRWREAWFRGVSMWNEVNDVCECESFDGHKRIMVEHTLHVLVFPGLHPHAQQPPTNGRTSTGGFLPHSESSISLRDYVTMATPSAIRNRHPDISLWPPSPFHLVLPMITRLSFNEAGKITHHRDFWDVKDLLGLVPGMTFVQWVTSRLAAQGIRNVVRAGRALLHAPSQDEEAKIGVRTRRCSESGPPPSKSSTLSHLNRTEFTLSPT
ncbi:hypothetical protein GSI_01092 [Ganoderma sinense ZZ0214-1]|uniref:Uncharacterized protein n=1 Tax=Ganoderma sinense ZZ0214-1 TaxID=1077348 RepID=A0A2G8SUZ6_9APHY|nr:hypothetical protein GSI_01092 [Ganoderma sinense ZZ0214-1]